MLEPILEILVVSLYNLRKMLEQILVVSLYNLRTLPQRLGTSLSTVAGIAGVVLVFVAVLSIATGFQRTMESTGDPQNVIVLRDGANDEMSSGLGLESTRIISDAPGVQRGEAGALASAELFVVVDVPKRGSGTAANVPLRGVSPAAFEVRGNVEMVEGRRFETGKGEIIVGQGAAQQFEGLYVGAEHKWGETVWKVVGIFSTGGTVSESEIWCDARVLQPAYRRGSSFQSVQVRLVSDDHTLFKETLEADPRLRVNVQSASEFYAGQSTVITNLINTLGMFIAVLMGFGAVFGALNTMYTAVASRAREIATLRAIGFSTVPVVISVILESLVLSAIGGVLGAGLAYVLFNGVQTATINWQTFSQVAFAFTVTTQLMVGGLIYALVMGLVGGLLPAVHAARLPVATALREL